MTAKDAIKAAQSAEKALSRTRASLASARGVVATHEAVCRELESQKQSEILKAGAAGKLPALTEVNHRLNAAREQLAETKNVVDTLMESESEAVRALVQAEKEAADAVRDAWDAEADRIREQLIQLAGPMLKSYWAARSNGGNPIALFTLLRTAGGLVSDLEGAAQDAEAVFDLGIPEVVESTMLTHEERTAGDRHTAMAI